MTYVDADAEYFLYRECFKELCVDINEYNKILKLNPNLKKIENLFEGDCGFVKSDLKIGGYRGEFANNIADCGERIFLFSYSDRILYEYNRDVVGKDIAYFFYDEYLIAVPVGYGSKDIKTSHLSYKKLNIKPVIIPLNKIASVSVKNDNHGFGRGIYIILKFENKLETDISLCNEDGISNKWIYSYSTWNYAVNKLLVNLSATDISSHADKIVEVINNLISIEKKKDSFDSILKIYFPKKYLDEILSVKYNKYEFIDKIVNNKDNMLETVKNDSFELYKAVNSYINVKKEIDNNITEDYNKENNNYSSTTFLKKFLFNVLKKDTNNNIYNKTKQLQEEKDNIYNCLLSLADTVNEAKSFYKECKSKKITDPMDEAQRYMFDMICKKNGYNNIDEAIKLYFIGKNSNVNKKKKTISNEKRNEAIVKYNTEKDIAEIVGVDKYLISEIKNAAEAKNKKEIMNLLGQYASTNAYTTSTKRDAAFWGGIASGIAGNAAGLYTASGIQADNIKSEQAAKKAREDGFKTLLETAQVSAEYSAKEKHINSVISSIKEKICDIDNKYFDYLLCNIDSYEKIDNDILEIHAKIKQSKPVKLNNNDFFLDGSVKINIMLDGNKCGDAYICAQGYDLGVVSDEIGFNVYDYDIYDIIGLLDFELSSAEIKKLSFEFEPYHLWIIEA